MRNLKQLKLENGIMCGYNYFRTNLAKAIISSSIDTLYIKNYHYGFPELTYIIERSQRIKKLILKGPVHDLATLSDALHKSHLTDLKLEIETGNLTAHLDFQFQVS